MADPRAEANVWSDASGSTSESSLAGEHLSVGAKPGRFLALTPCLWSLALLVLFGQLVVYLAHVAATFGFPFDLDQGEGYDVNAGWLIAQGRPMYTDNAAYPYFSSNYPPLYAVAVAAAIPLWGPSPPTGRAVSIAATLGLGGLIFLEARRQAGGTAGLIAAGFFWLSNYVFHVTALARVNALAAFLALAGLLCVARLRPRKLAVGAGLLLGALFTKPTAIDAAAAALLYAWLVDRRAALVMGAGLAASGLLLAAALEVSTSGAFLLNVVHGNLNPFVPGQLQEYFANFGLLHAVPLALAGPSTIGALAARRPDAIHLFFLAGITMALGVGKWGAGESYFLSAIVATSLLAGCVAARAIGRGGLPAKILPLLILGQSAVSAHGAVSLWLPPLPDRGLQASALAHEPTLADLELGHSIVTRLRSMPGPGLVEDASFALAAGKDVVGNATHLRNLSEAGRWRGENLVADLEARRYHTVVLDAELYPGPVLSAIGRRYFLFDAVSVYGTRQKVFVPGAS